MSKILTLETILSRANSKSPESIKQLNLWGLQVSDISILSKLPLLETISLSNNQIIHPLLHLLFWYSLLS